MGLAFPLGLLTAALIYETAAATRTSSEENHVSKTGAPRKYSFATYRAEAKVQPFVLDTGTDAGDLTITVPTGETLLAIADDQGNPRRVLRLLCGEQYDAVMELVGPAPAEVLTALIGDMTAHFGMTGSPGDTAASSS